MRAALYKNQVVLIDLAINTLNGDAGDVVVPIVGIRQVATTLDAFVELDGQMRIEVNGRIFIAIGVASQRVRA